MKLRWLWWLLCTNRIRNNEAQFFLRQFEHLQSIEKKNKKIKIFYNWIMVLLSYLIEFIKFWEIHRLISSSICRHWVSNYSWFIFDVFIVSWYRCNQWMFQWSYKNVSFRFCMYHKDILVEHTFNRTCINQRSSPSWTGRWQSIGRSITTSCCSQHSCVCCCSLKVKTVFSDKENSE